MPLIQPRIGGKTAACVLYLTDKCGPAKSFDVTKDHDKGTCVVTVEHEDGGKSFIAGFIASDVSVTPSDDILTNR